LKRAAARSSSNEAIPSTLAVARAGVSLGLRRRALASSVLERVIAAVPAKPAKRPFPTALASVPATLALRSEARDIYVDGVIEDRPVTKFS
jgi:hypothetical protein